MNTFKYAKKTTITNLFNNSSSLHYPISILESIHWMQTVYAVLCQLWHADTLFMSFTIWFKWKQRLHWLLDSICSLHCYASWLTVLWMSGQIINSTDSFKKAFYSEAKQMTNEIENVLMTNLCLANMQTLINIVDFCVFISCLDSPLMAPIHCTRSVGEQVT